MSGYKTTDSHLFPLRPEEQASMDEAEMESVGREETGHE